VISSANVSESKHIFHVQPQFNVIELFQ